MTPTESRRRLPMHHRVAVTPEPACHFHPSFFQPLLVRKQERPGGGRGRGTGKDGWGGGRWEEEDGREEKGEKRGKRKKRVVEEEEADEERR